MLSGKYDQRSMGVQFRLDVGEVPRTVCVGRLARAYCYGYLVETQDQACIYGESELIRFHLLQR